MQRDEEESETGDWIFAGIATDEQARELREFEDYQDFLIATNETGLRSWLNKHRQLDEEPTEPEPMKMTHEEFYAEGYESGRPVPQVTPGSASTGDRPPPGGS